MNIATFISVIIATCNRCQSLRDTLDSLSHQEMDRFFDYEVIIVDSNSKDKTKETVESYMGEFNGRIKYLFEPMRGKSYALNRGISSAKGEIFVFTDDDVIVDKSWLLNIFRCFKNYNCEGMGGRVLPLYPKDTPKWVKDNKQSLMGPIVMHDYSDDIEIHDSASMVPFIGANMAFRKSCFNSYGLFRTDLGPGKGTMGDDTEFFRRIENNTKNLYYCGKALVWHKVDKERLSYRYIAKWFFNCGRSNVRKNYGKSRDGFICYFGIPRYIFREIIENIISLIINLRNKERFLKSFKKTFTYIGRVWEYISF